jgi:ketosteroid isomerase-like protein
MSQADVDMVRRWYRAFGDEAAFCELTHPEIEWAPVEQNHTIYRGLDGAKHVLAEWSGSWSSYDGHFERVIDAGQQGIVVVLCATARGAASGAEVDFRAYCHFKFREGKVIYLYEYASLADALNAVGIEE